jgi:magnesium transporter
MESFMNASASAAVAALNLRFLLDYPGEAARRLELMSAEEVAALLAAQPPHAVVPVWEQLASDIEQAVIELLPDDMVRHLLTELEPALAAGLLARLESAQRQHCVSLLEPQIAAELKKLMDYAPDTAGQLMDPRFVTLRSGFTVHEALTRLRTLKRREVHEIFLVDGTGHLEGRARIQDLAMAAPELQLERLRRKISAVVSDIAPREEVVELLERNDISDLPVVDFSGRLVGVIRQSALVSAVQEEASLDIQTMVGASKDERALSRAGFAVLKRLPWLQINLLTAFLAASVVGLFEGTIAKFTALAVLLPVVAGQSGNAGAQALAVTMRGLVLREISLRHWPRVVLKEINVGFLNGLAIAATTALGVYVWSGSLGLVIIISAAMVISMVAAGLAGALVPITLSRFGQDPAQSSSIILTTVTDIVGFFSFLGIATLLSGMLQPA